jgi:hypothetical protein
MVGGIFVAADLPLLIAGRLVFLLTLDNAQVSLLQAARAPALPTLSRCKYPTTLAPAPAVRLRVSSS